MKLKKIISDLGYKPISKSTIELKIFGMHSTHCSNLIENTLKKIEGIIKAKVEFANHRAIISYDPNILTKERIKKIITELGYKIEEKKEVEEETKTLKKRFFVSLFFGIPLLYFSMGWMIGLPVIKNVYYQALIQLVLTTPIIFAIFTA